MALSIFPNEEAEEIVDPVSTIDGPLLIIAGPGAGKTWTLVERSFTSIASLR